MKFLRNLLGKLLRLFNFESPGGGVSYGVAPEKEILEEYLRFLMEVLQAEVDSNGDPGVVYGLLAENQDKLDLTFAEILKRWFESEVESDNSERNQFLAGTLNDFAIDIFNFPLGSRANNLEIAIASYQAALDIYTRQAFPEKWAMTQNNLGIVYSNRIRGERAENLEMAIASYQAALDIYTRQAFPEKWAMTQNNLGGAYLYRIRGEQAENLEKAIGSYQAALDIYTRQAFPEKWAMTQNNLGSAYLYRIRGERANNLEKAIASYQAALDIYTRQAFPEKWAMTQNNLGNVYSDRIRGERANNLEKAIGSYQAALDIRTPSSFPLKCLKTGENLGNLAFEIENWETAIFGYNQAILAVEQSRNWAFSELTKREIIENALFVYQRMVQVCINHQDYPQALLTVERSKSQTLIELLNSTDLYPKNATDEQKQGIRKLRSQIASYQQQLMGNREQELKGGGLAGETGENFSYTPETDIRTQLQTANEQFQQLLAEIGDPDFNLTQQVTPQLPDLNHLLDSETAILEWYLPASDESNFYLFLITPSPDKNFQIQPLTFPPEDYQKLKQAIKDYRSDYKKHIRERQLEKHLPILSQTLHLSELLCQLTNYQRLILIPHRELHLIPLHALPISDSESQILEDKFLIQYSPSCQILDNLHRRRHPKPDTCHFFAMQNPTEDLTYTDLQIEVLQRQFISQRIIPHIQATKATLNKPENQDFLRQATHIHLTGHGEFDEESPGKSYIRLANKEKLTFFDIFENLNIPNCGLLILSPCKTGLVETPPTDDYVGLASAFFYAGSQTVIASLWETYDFPTALLMIRLYQELFPKLPKFVSVVEALRKAQYWLRNVSRQEVLIWLSGLSLSENEMKNCRKELRLYNKANPFVAPKYWAAFTVNGL